MDHGGVMTSVTDKFNSLYTWRGIENLLLVLDIAEFDHKDTNSDCVPYTLQFRDSIHWLLKLK